MVCIVFYIYITHCYIDYDISIQEDTDLLKVKSGETLMMMGTAEVLNENPAKPVVFEEDMSAAQRMQLSQAYIQIYREIELNRIKV